MPRIRIRHPMPLVDSPKSKEFIIRGSRSELKLTITACPDQWLTYSCVWTQTPPAGIRAICVAQVQMKRGSKGADTMPSIRAESTGNFFLGSPVGLGRGVRLHGHQLALVDDFDLIDKRIEERA